jgi:hypothetical protein
MTTMTPMQQLIRQIQILQQQKVLQCQVQALPLAGGLLLLLLHGCLALLAWAVLLVVML